MIKLNNGKEIPQLGFGTWKSEKNIVGEAVKTAIEVGYRHIDCAKAYKNEEEIGEALKSVFDSGKIKREDMFITSKLWNADHKPENVVEACRKTLSDLKLEYLDLYLMHWGIAFEHEPGDSILNENGIVKTEKVPLNDTWHAMEKLVDEGLVKSIGVSNFTPPMILDLLNYADIKPVINQVEIHPYNTQVELVEFCHSHDIHVTAYSPLGGSGSSDPSPITDAVILDISKNHDKSPAQILIKWSLQRGLVVIPKSTNPERIRDNFELNDFELNEEEMKKITALNKNKRFVDPINFWGVPYFK